VQTTDQAKPSPCLYKKRLHWVFKLDVFFGLRSDQRCASSEAQHESGASHTGPLGPGSLAPLISLIESFQLNCMLRLLTQHPDALLMEPIPYRDIQ